jgi:hypothetical protein
MIAFTALPRTLAADIDLAMVFGGETLPEGLESSVSLRERAEA